MNHLAIRDFCRDDAEQFAQLIGYSLSGFSELSYVSDEVYSAAVETWERGSDEKDARIATLTKKIGFLRSEMRDAVAELYGIHPDDLSETS